MTAYPPLPRPDTTEGEPRRVGVEIEFGGLTVEDAVRAARKVFGDAEIDRQSQHHQTLADPELGDFTLELDMARRHREAFAHKEGAEDDPVRKITGDIVHWLTPVELVAPPLAPERLPALDPLIEALRTAGATGAGHGAQTAYGMHFNVEAVSLSVDHLLPVTRSFALLEDWLRKTLEISLNRRLTGFVKSYPREYIDTVAAEGYAPDRARFFDDYLSANPTRNRALDLTPIIEMADPDRAQAVLGDEKRSARPTFHYRLPDARVDEKGWSPVPDWTLWRVIERAAEDPALTMALTLGWREHRDRWTATREDWVQRCTDMLRAAGLVDARGAPTE
ncbi:amidoligase family protein [Rhodovulum sp. DZ06]|uniref:amidoligase family protein n=1 Tax=Rhodovulum sp. DZ06 TaxID=3425126 RepID=UPI003D32CB49